MLLCGVRSSGKLYIFNRLVVASFLELAVSLFISSQQVSIGCSAVSPPTPSDEYESVGSNGSKMWRAVEQLPQKRNTKIKGNKKCPTWHESITTGGLRDGCFLITFCRSLAGKMRATPE